MEHKNWTTKTRTHYLFKTCDKNCKRIPNILLPRDTRVSHGCGHVPTQFSDPPPSPNYITGFLPIEVSNAVPSSPVVKTVSTPPLPPRQTPNSRNIPSLASLHTVEQPPPLPPKLFCTTPRSDSALHTLCGGCFSY